MARKATTTEKKTTARKVNWNENAFDALAKTAPTSKSSTKPIVEVSDSIRKAVDAYLKAKAAEAKAKAEKEQSGEAIIDHVRKQQDKDAYAGKFSKSYEVPGTGDNKTTFVASDKFSVAQEAEVHDGIKDIVGDNYPLVVTKVRTITLNEKMQQNEEFINKLVKLLADSELSLADAFEVTDKWVVVKGMDEAQYNLVPNTKLDEFRTLVKQAKPSLK